MTPSGSAFGPEACAKILARVELGVAFNDAAQAAGVKVSTAKHWLARGRKEEAGAYADFAAAVEVARETSSSRPAPMSAEEFRGQVEQAVRGGSVQAMKLFADTFLRPDEEPEPEQPPSKIAELADRRRAGG